MTDRTPDDRPLFPRRPLAARGRSDPDERPPQQPAAPASEPAGRGWGQPAHRDGGPPTAALPRVEEPARTQPPGQQQRLSESVPDAPVSPPVRPASGPDATAATYAATTTTVPATAAAAPGTPVRAAASAHPAAAPARKPKRTRRARLRMVRIDPWSVMKMAFALSVALAVVLVIAVAIVWSVLDTAGVWQAINESAATLIDAQAGEQEFDVEEFVGFRRVMGLTAVIAVADIVLLTALATLAAFMYNLTSALLGGLEVTLAEDR